MSNLSAADLSSVSALVDFERGPGYVLDFSDRTFLKFFATQFGIDIAEPRYCDMGGSKGKRLRRFLELTDDATATKLLRALWKHRVSLLDGRSDPVANAESKYQTVLNKVQGHGPAKAASPARPSAADIMTLDRLKSEVLALSSMAPQPRGFAFEKFLKGLFELNGLDPRGSFRNRGEQIDGSFMLSNSTYLLEAKWQSLSIGAADLHSFEGKLGEKASWVRGLYVSYSGFSDDGLFAFGRGKRTLCMDGRDLYELLDRRLRLDQVLDAKARRAAETGDTFVRVSDLF